MEKTVSGIGILNSNLFSDLFFLQCNTIYMALSEEGGDLPIRWYVDGEFHIEGDLILAGKDTQFMTFQNIEPILRILEDWRVFLLTPMLRYLQEGCNELEHAPNRYTPGSLAEFRSNHKDFIFTRGLRGFKVIDPSAVLPNITGKFNIWEEDPVHPEGYERMVDILEKELQPKMTGGGKRGAPEGVGGHPKRPRVKVPRPSWIESSSLSAKRSDVGNRGQGGYYGGTSSTGYYGSGGGMRRPFHSWGRS
jgi:hypothetical protein